MYNITSDHDTAANCGQIDEICANPVDGLQPVAPMNQSFLGWYQGGYLPHFDSMLLVQSVTFRLVDSLPIHVLRRIEQELSEVPASIRKRERRIRTERWLDSGLGCCALSHPRMAEKMEEALMKFHGNRYLMLAWCIMPNHVHALFDQFVPLRTILRSWKSYTGRWAIAHNDDLGLGIPGLDRSGDDGREPVSRRFWMRDYWDRFVRNEDHLQNARRYIHENPVLAGLCSRPEHWQYSSARFRLRC
jgi:putative transposase